MASDFREGLPSHEGHVLIQETRNTTNICVTVIHCMLEIPCALLDGMSSTSFFGPGYRE